nr:cytochrome p450 CYP3047A1 [Brachionus angularis]
MVKINISRQNLSTITNAKLKTYDEIPGPKGYPIVGNLFSIKELGGEFTTNRFDKFVQELYNQYGELVKWSILGHKQIFIYNPDHAKLVFQVEGQIPIRPVVIPWQIYSKRKNYPPGLINSQGEEWKKQRSASNPIVARPKSVVTYLDTHNKITNEFIQILNNNFKTKQDNSFIVDKFQNELKFLTLEMMSVVAFDHRLECINPNKRQQVIDDLITNIEKYSILTSKLFYSFPLWRLYRNSVWVEFEQVSDFIFDFTRKYVEESFKLMKEQNNNQNQTMLQQYIKNQDKINLKLEELVSVMSEFLLGAFDTSSTTLHFLFQLLGTNLDIQEEIYQEIISVYPNNDYIDEDILSKIPLLKASIKESKRIFSTSPTVGRITSVDLVINNYLIPKNTLVNIGYEIIGNLEKYFKDAKKFNPKRWLKENQQSEPIHPYSSLPFGFGARMCIGRRLAEQKMYLIIIKLLKNYKIEYIGDKELKSSFRLITVPQFDLKLKFTKR